MSTQKGLLVSLAVVLIGIGALVLGHALNNPLPLSAKVDITEIAVTSFATTVVETHPVKYIRTYHVRFEDINKPTLDKIFALQGVIYDGSKYTHHSRYRKGTYELTIHKGGAFHWEEIQPKVLSILESYAVHMLASDTDDTEDERLAVEELGLLEGEPEITFEFKDDEVSGQSHYQIPFERTVKVHGI